MGNYRKLLLACAMLFIFESFVIAQGTGVAWGGPGPSVNVKAYGAFGDVQQAMDGTISGSTKNILTYSTANFSPTDVGKSIWIDQSPFPAPALSITVHDITSSTSCAGTPLLQNLSGYQIHVYYRITYKNSTFGEGDASAEGFTSLPVPSGNPLLTFYCVLITSPPMPTNAFNYKVYFSADAPPRWKIHTTYTNTGGATPYVYDSNGNVEQLISGSGGMSGASEPGWSTTVGMTTPETSLTWLNIGPVVPGSGSGSEGFQSLAANCANGSPMVNPGVQNCELDDVQVNPSNPPPQNAYFAAGVITAVNTISKQITFSNASSVVSGNTISNVNYAWGHDDTAAVNNALTTLTGLTLAPGGTLFFPVSSGCYGITSLINAPSTGGSFLALTGEGSASSKQLGGPGIVSPPQQPGASCIATIGQNAGFAFPQAGSSALNGGPIVERLAFIDPFGVATAPLTFNTNSSTKVINNSFQSYASGTAILFNAQQGTSSTPLKYNQFVEVSDNVCISVKSCIIMGQGVTNPAWIERNRCVSAQMGGGRCVGLGPNLFGSTLPLSPLTAGATNWIVENFGLYFPVTFESIDQFADYWIGNSDQQTANLQNGGMPFLDIIGNPNSGTGLHVGATVTNPVPSPPLCHDNEVIAGNTALNLVGLFIDSLCQSSLYLGYTVSNNNNNNPLIKDFGTQSTFWNQELGMSVSAPSGVNPLTVQNSSGSTAWQVLPSGSFKFLGSGSSPVTIDSAATSAYTFQLPTSLGSMAGLPLLSATAGNPLTFGPLNLSTAGTVTGTLPAANGGTNVSSFAFSGNTSTAVSVSGPTTLNAYTKFDANGNVVAGGCTDDGTTLTCSTPTNNLSNSQFVIGSGGKLTKYANSTVVGNGASTVIAVSNVTNQTSSQAAVTLATLAATGQFAIEYYVDQRTTCSSPGSGKVTLTFNWTDITTGRTMNSSSLLFTSTGSNTGFVSNRLPIFAATGSTVTYSSTYAPCTTGTAAYDAHVALVQLQ